MKKIVYAIIFVVVIIAAGFLWYEYTQPSLSIESVSFNKIQIKNTGAVDLTDFNAKINDVPFKFTIDKISLKPGEIANIKPVMYFANKNDNIVEVSVSPDCSDEKKFDSNALFWTDFDDVAIGNNALFDIPPESDWIITNGKLTDTVDHSQSTSPFLWVNQTNITTYEWEATYFEFGSEMADNGGGLRIFIKNPNYFASDSYLIYQNRNGMAIVKYIYASSGSPATVLDYFEVSASENTLYSFKVVYNPGNGKFDIWRNGLFVGSTIDGNQLRSGTGVFFYIQGYETDVHFDDLKVY